MNKMETQKIFRTSYVAKLINTLKESNGDDYLSDDFAYSKEGEIPNIEIKVKQSELILPEGGHLNDFENSKIVFGSYPFLNPVQATDPRLWTYLSHVTYWKYMKARRPIEEQPSSKRVDYILEHWFVRPSAESLLRNDISLLWWVSYLTYDESRKDPYELTSEAFSMLDYTRHLLPGTQGRNRDFTHALLEYVIENRDLFKDYKESKVRFLMRKANNIAGYKVFPGLSKAEIKNIFENYKEETAAIRI
jgi:hypothetical protein